MHSSGQEGARTLFVTSVPHPLTLYAKQVVAQLDEDDLKIVYDLLQPEFNLPPTLKKENTYLCLVQAIQDDCPPIYRLVAGLATYVDGFSEIEASQGRLFEFRHFQHGGFL